MKPQNFEIKNQQIDEDFEKLKREQPEKLKNALKLSWSNWGFGQENLSDTVARLHKFGLEYIELHGNHYGADLGYKASQVKKILNDHGLKTSGICGMFSPDNDLSSNRGIHRQAAIDYIRRELDFAQEMNADYLLVVPAAVGRPNRYDDSELQRSVETLRLVADEFLKANIRAAVEPIRAAETSMVHTIREAKYYIEQVNHPGISYINGDTYHMLAGEDHIPSALLEAGSMLTNLHAADTNRCALGAGSLDIDRIIKALYLIGYNRDGCYVTPEPLGPGGDPYPAMFGQTDSQILDALVSDTVTYFREREALIVG